MKKKILGGLFSLAAIALLFSSCLGDNDSTFESSNDFAYIGSSQYGTKYAFVSNYWVGVTPPSQSTALNGVNIGDCVYLSYKINQSNVTSENFFQADEMTVESVLPKNALPVYESAAPESLDDPATNVEEVFRTGFNLLKYYPSDGLGDNWLFTVTTKRADNEVIKAHFYYDANRQYVEGTGGNQTATGDNQIVLDVLFSKVNNGGTQASQAYQFVQNFASFRQSLIAMRGGKVKPTESDGYTIANVGIMFRIREKDSTTNVISEKYTPSTWSDSPFFQLIFQ